MTCKEKILSEEYYDWITDFELTPQLLAVNQKEEDYCYKRLENGVGIAYVKKETGNSLSLWNYPYQYIPNIYGIQAISQDSNSVFDPKALELSGIIDIQNGPLQLSGRDVVLGFLDTGIDYQNRAFLRRDGSSRILAIWDQTDQNGTPPEGFDYGSQYRREEITVALQTDNPYSVVPTRDEVGHGTALAAVAAGSSQTASGFIGAAYEADIVMVKLKPCKSYLREYYLLPQEALAYQENDILAALTYLDSFAQSFFRPLVVCFGLGSNWGSHTGKSVLEKYCNYFANKRSRIFVIGGGNQGSGGTHYQGNFVPNQEKLVDGSSLRTEVELKVGKEPQGILLEFWGKAPNTFSLSIVSPSGERIPSSGDTLQDGQYGFILTSTLVTVASTPVESVTGEQRIVIRMENPTEGLWTFRIRQQENIGKGSFSLRLPLNRFLSGETYFLQGNPGITLTLPSLAEEVITVAGYNSANGSVYIESGRGFSGDGKIKPDICAPAVGILSPIRSLTEENKLQAYTGNSMAAAIAAGACALFMEWAVVQKNMPYLSCSTVKNYFIRGARREGIYSYPNSMHGYGWLDLKKAIEESRKV